MKEMRKIADENEEDQRDNDLKVLSLVLEALQLIVAVVGVLLLLRG